MRRIEYNQLAGYRVSEKDLADPLRLKEVIFFANSIGGPQIRFDEEGGRGYGLFAERDYLKGEKVTGYGGAACPKGSAGDYVAVFQGPEGRCIDGRYGFRLDEKGRWVNEYSSDVKEREIHTNVRFGTSIRTTRIVEKGEQFFADYGEDYQRRY